MPKGSVSDVDRFPMSIITYHSNHSSISNFFSLQRKEKIVFYSMECWNLRVTEAKLLTNPHLILLTYMMHSLSSLEALDTKIDLHITRYKHLLLSLCFQC